MRVLDKLVIILLCQNDSEYEYNDPSFGMTIRMNKISTVVTRIPRNAYMMYVIKKKTWQIVSCKNQNKQIKKKTAKGLF